MKTYQKYDAYDNGVLTHENMSATELQRLIGIKLKEVNRYCKTGNIYHKQWRFTIHGEELSENGENSMTRDQCIAWDKMRVAFLLLKEGKAKIVCENGVRYTKRKPGVI